MTWVFWLLVVPAAGLVAGGGLRAVGVPRRAARFAGVAAAIATAVAIASLFVVALQECVSDNPDPEVEASWPWSPRRELCDGGGSPAALGAVALLAVPSVAVVLGTFLRWKGKPGIAWIPYAVVLATPLLPAAYVDALPVYRVDEYPVLHQPLLRPAAPSRPPRVCYVHGIAFGPRKAEVTPATPRTCLELRPTRQAVTLTTEYDEGRTPFDLDLMGENLSERGLPVRPGETGVDGLVVARVYTLPDREARVGSTLVE